MQDSRRILVVMEAPGEWEQSSKAFSDLPDGWTFFRVQDRFEALRRLEEERFNLVIAQLNPNPFETVQFLHEVWARSPKTIRFLLADTTEPDVVTACAVGAHQFFQKPVTHFSLLSALERGEFMERLLGEPETKNLLARIRTLPPRPSLYEDVLQEIRSESSSALSVAELVEKDMAVSAKLIQLTHSAALSFPQPVTTARDAVLLIGMERTAALVLAVEAFSRLDQQNLPNGFSVEQLWSHSQTVGVYARGITQLMTGNRQMADQAYTAGLLHDIGKLALALNVPEDHHLATQEARKRNVPGWEMEQQLLGATHAEAGAYLLATWGLPLAVIEAVASHHLPAKNLPARFSPCTAVHLANALDHASGLLRDGSKEFRLDLDYPSDSELHSNLESILETLQFPVGPAVQKFLNSLTPRLNESAAPLVNPASALLKPRSWLGSFFRA